MVVSECVMFKAMEYNFDRTRIVLRFFKATTGVPSSRLEKAKN